MFSLQAFSEITQALENARRDDSKVVLISAKGSVFCAGLDLSLIIDGKQTELLEKVK